MRRLITRRMRDERGAVAIVVAISMVALLGFTALAIDVGALYSERAQLQNGADSAALAVAQDCAKDHCTATDVAAVATTAVKAANANADDNASRVDPPLVSGSTVTVTTRTKDGASGAGALASTFAWLLPGDTGAVQVDARAKAKWGVPVNGPAVLPLVFSRCSFILRPDPDPNPNVLQLIKGSKYSPTAGTTVPSDCAAGVAGPPGGFGWLDGSGATCNFAPNIAVGGGAPVDTSSNTGENLPTGCDVVLDRALGTTVLVPVFDSVTASGTNASYRISGWAAFKLVAYNFPSKQSANLVGLVVDGKTCNNGTGCRGLIGRFEKFVSFDERFTTGLPGPTDYGTDIVTLITE